MIRYFFSFSLALFLLACNGTEQTPTTDESSTTTHLHLDGEGQKIVLVSGDEEYRSEEMMPQLARILNKHHGLDCQVLFAQHPDTLGIVNPNYTKNIPGLDALEDADLLILFIRFRELPNDQMQYIENYLAQGKPIIGIRTATHAFHFTDTTHQWKHWGNYHTSSDEWNGGFGRLVLGERWHTHHGHHKHQSTRGIISTEHPTTNGIEDGDIWGATDVYGVRLPLPDNAQPLVFGQVINRAGAYQENDLLYGMRDSDSTMASINPASQTAYDPNNPMMPIAWLKTYQLPNSETSGQAFTSTIGASTDLLNEGVRRLLVNATYFLLNKVVPESANVDLVGDYTPTPFAFQSDEYWTEKQMKIADL